jgi:hypothetical protein
MAMKARMEWPEPVLEDIPAKPKAKPEAVPPRDTSMPKRFKWGLCVGVILFITILLLVIF